MLFSSITFLYLFLPIIILLYFIIPKKLKNFILLFGSLFFYSFETPKFFIVMISCILITFINGILIGKFHNKIHYILSLIISLAPLIYFKYTDFFIQNINNVFNSNLNLLKLVLPIGISFYTFQMLSYLVDVYKNKVDACYNFIDFALYVSFFPQLIAGPIVKYSDIKQQLKFRQNNIDNISQGIFLFCIGLGKKVLIANQLGEFCNLYDVNNTTILASWTYMLCYTMHVYFDFSGYSTMAIGLGKIFGFELPINFNYPLCSTSIKDFWRKWHITLSSFFKEYVYIPLGGNRCSKKRWILNLFIVWFLTGFWHGANWTFIAWGLFFFILLIIESLIKNKIPKCIYCIYTLYNIMISFLLFGSNSISEFIHKFKNLFIGTFINEQTIFNLKNFGFLIIISIFLATPICKNLYEKKKNLKIFTILEPVLIGVLLMLSTAYLIDGSFNPFLYFRF